MHALNLQNKSIQTMYTNLYKQIYTKKIYNQTLIL